MLYLNAVRVDIIDLEASLPIVVEGGQKVIKVSDSNTEYLTNALLKEIQALNFQLALLTGNVIDKGELR